MSFDLDQPLCRLGGLLWTPWDSFQGTLILGDPRVGKSTRGGSYLARAMLRAGYGGLVLSVKDNEARRWTEYAAETGRAQDLVLVQPGRDSFDFMAWECERATRGGGLTHNLTQLFLRTIQDRASTTDPYWDRAVEERLSHSIAVAKLATRSVNLSTLHAVITSAPTARRSRNWEDSQCVRLIAEAHRRADLTPAERADLALAIKYFGTELPALDTRVRSIVESCWSGRAAQLLRSPLREMFATPGPPTFPPELSHQGRIIVLDLPVHSYGDAGLFAQRIYLAAWQGAAVQRDIPNARPLFLWIDEAHHFIGSSNADLLFASGCGESRVAFVMISQNLNNYFALSGARDPRSSTTGLLGCLHNKIFFRNSDPDTNEWAERVFAKTTQYMEGYSYGDPVPTPGNRDYLEVPGRSPGNTNVTPHDRWRISAVDFTKLPFGHAYIHAREGLALRHNFEHQP